MSGELRAISTNRHEAFLPSPSVQNHAAFLSWQPDGSLACAWFGGTLEGKSDICIHLCLLGKDATTWGKTTRIEGDANRSEQNPVLFQSPKGGLLLFHTSQPDGNQDQSKVRVRTLDVAPANPGQIIAHPARDLPLQPGTFIRAPIIVRKDGAWLLPLFLCNARPGYRWNGSFDTAALAISTDHGQTWSQTDIPGSEGAVHMTIVPLDDGRMVAFYRRRQADFVFRSDSNDDGRTWSPPAATDIPNNNSSIAAIRLSDGRIALLCNPVSAAMSRDRRNSLYDELDVADSRPDAQDGCKPVWGVPRAPLTLCVSDDGGHTFPKRKIVEDGPGTCLSNNSLDGENKELSYPALTEGPDGSLHLAFTYHRRAIKYIRLAPGWLDGDPQ
ncbi:glycosyl hydrolase [Thalassospira profundimaris]|uniref:Glycosyl hydrolase n=2 Tax=Thalassospira profundimaris TaxID=502049 RepID=A0A367XAX4_9PROT|nr:glycosyl hydrolase [Thalassospira profundimaris]